MPPANPAGRAEPSVIGLIIKFGEATFAC